MPSFASTQNPSGRGAINSGPRGGRGSNIEDVAVQNPLYNAAQLVGPQSGGIPTRDSSNGANGTGPNPTGPFFNSTSQKFRQFWTLAGVTRDSVGTALGLCTVHLFLTEGDLEVAEQVSDTNGNFSFNLGTGTGTKYYHVDYLVGSPDRAGTSANTLVPVLT